ncbi:DUF559 domain-containing protein [Microlunatus elymi]|uniref:DUF559 domain-containing protein n=1 Tax=Microlunatus elymi TaxID=2596828 RepID=A0A516PYU6_9ACTN|nr:DUF559 domain-containing protein [Microlunatus elymi]QDP96337.1 DUF559 domain-containing protein [Microlunatus elymi]
MRASHNQHLIHEVLQWNGVIARRAHLDLSQTIGRMLRAGELVALLPGVYTWARWAGDPTVRLLAVAAWSPDAVVCRLAAARLTFWPEVDHGELDLAVSDRRCSAKGFRLHRRRLPPEHIVGWPLLGEDAATDGRGIVPITGPALTAVDLCAELGGEPIDRVLRSRQARLADLRGALECTAHRSGNRDRRRVLVESRAEPWSAAERKGHRLLFEAGIGGWFANFEVAVGGKTYYLDIAFPHLKLAVEIDGRFHEDDPDQFQSDRERQNAVQLAGWFVLRFTWYDLVDRPKVVIAQIRAALARCRKLAGIR